MQQASVVEVEIRQDLEEAGLLAVEGLEVGSVLQPWVADLSVHQVQERKPDPVVVALEVRVREVERKDQVVVEVAAAVGWERVAHRSEVRMVQAHEWEELTLVLEAAEDACQVVAATAVDQQSGFGSDELEVHLELVGTWYGLEHILRLHGLVVRETDQDSSPVEDLRDQ